MKKAVLITILSLLLSLIPSEAQNIDSRLTGLSSRRLASSDNNVKQATEWLTDLTSKVYPEGHTRYQQVKTFPELQQLIASLQEEVTLYESSGKTEEKINVLILLAQIHHRLGQLQKLEYTKQTDSRNTELFNLASDNFDKSIQYAQQALVLAQESKDKFQQASALTIQGNAYSETPVLKEKTISIYQQANELWRQLNNQAGIAYTLMKIGDEYILSEKPTAIGYYGQALSLWGKTEYVKEVVHILHWMGKLYSQEGEHGQAIKYLAEALNIIDTGNYSNLEVTIEPNIGSVYLLKLETELAMGISLIRNNQPEQAIKHLEVITSSLENGGDYRLLYGAFLQLGNAYEQIEDDKKALQSFSQARTLATQARAKIEESTVLREVARLYLKNEDYQPALDAYLQALEVLRSHLKTFPQSKGGGTASVVKYLEASMLNQIGFIFNRLGNYEEALDFFLQALNINQESGNKPEEANSSQNVGVAYDGLKEYQKAKQYLEKALVMFEENDDKRRQAIALRNIANIDIKQENEEKALENLNKALSLIQQVDAPDWEASILERLATLLIKKEQFAQANTYLNKALPLARRAKSRTEERSILVRLSELERNRNNLQKALSYINEAITIVKSFESNLVSSEARISYRATAQSVYKVKIDILMKLDEENPNQGYIEQALQTNEESLARGLIELLSEDNNTSNISTDLLQKEQTLQAAINTRAKQKNDLLSREHLDIEVEIIDHELTELRRAYIETKREIRAEKLPNIATNETPLLTLQKMQQEILDSDSLLLEYSLGKEQSYLWVVSSNSIQGYKLPSREEIEAKARPFRKSIKTPPDSFESSETKAEKLKNAQSLSNILLGNIADQLGTKRLIIVGDGILNNIPFAALPIPSPEQNSSNNLSEEDNLLTPLLVNHEIVKIPSATTISVLRQQQSQKRKAQKTLAVIADPVFEATDPRILTPEVAQKPNQTSNIVSNLERSLKSVDRPRPIPRLDGTREEAENILSLVPSEQTTKALDFEANRTFVMNGGLNDYQIIHFATHGFLSSDSPELSGIVLSLVDENGSEQNGFLRLNDIYDLELNAELVVLSACQTGLGEEIRGEGLVGLTRGFMYAGVPSLVVSLWDVNDLGTSRLMSRFYENYLSEKMTPAAALRAAQIEMWKQEKWRSPYYWSAFTLQGDWQPINRLENFSTSEEPLAQPIETTQNTATNSDIVPNNELITPIVGQLINHNSSITALTISSDGKLLLSGDSNGQVNLWNVRSGKLIKTYRKSNDPNLSSDIDILRFNSDNQTFQLISRGVFSKDLVSGQTINSTRSMPILSSSGLSEALSVKGDKIYLPSTQINHDPLSRQDVNETSNIITIVDTNSGEVIKTLTGQLTNTEGLSNLIRISSDDKILVSALGKGSLEIWNLEGNSSFLIQEAHTGIIEDIAISPNNQILASSDWSNGSLKLWDLKTGNLLSQLESEDVLSGFKTRNWISKLVFTSDSQKLITGKSNGQIEVWDIQSRKRLQTISNSSEKIESLAISPDNKTLVIGYRNGKIDFFDFNTNKFN
ncbi:hypothetical protein CWATWH0402_3461 [Crocosphaera watsonii WH 0402]|uniref:CHAT domain-containing protein n=1 Tax=Crocosphaera watsonii WH 0402 TaxID=1284629 RepID=T2JV39_CROWT|nr:CHAT domain-containing protein [Crocosphaera watsonii]CCQ69688.1 hypothetical protein CWATWH0402_3461 [Crocosphaera watsonii WH 0402]